MKQGDTIYSIKDLLNRATVLTPPQKIYISDGQVEMVEIERFSKKRKNKEKTIDMLCKKLIKYAI